MKNRTRSVGFTVVELMVVLTIGILIAGVVGTEVLKQLGSAKTKTARLQIEDLGAALDLYYLDNGAYPDTQQGLDALLRAPSDATNWNGPYLKKGKIPEDPWNNPYQYESPGQNGP